MGRSHPCYREKDPSRTRSAERQIGPKHAASILRKVLLGEAHGSPPQETQQVQQAEQAQQGQPVPLSRCRKALRLCSEPVDSHPIIRSFQAHFPLARTARMCSGGRKRRK